MAGLGVWVVAACLGGLLSCISMLFNTIQQEPYMDEVFHVPQAQKYCMHNFSYWDPMITTPPGLYFSSLLWLDPLSRMLQLPTQSLCTTAVLRNQNIALSVLIFIVLHWLQHTVHRAQGSGDLLLSSLNLATFPLLFFFVFLYYTDVGATFLVLLGYALSVKGHHFTAASVLLISVCFRQTSVVWLVFVAGTSALHIVEPKFYTEKTCTIVSRVTLFLRLLSNNLTALVLVLWPYILAVLAFLAFLVANGSVVLGDKEHHKASLHLPQTFYFFTFACALASGHIVFSPWMLGGLLKALRSRVVWSLGFLILTGCAFIAVHHFTYEHPYLLADNRHYPFYIWQKLMRRDPNLRYYLVPVYSTAALMVLYILSRVQSSLWVLLYCVCCLTALTPQQLLEFRYFIVPYLIFRVHMPVSPHIKLSLLAELATYTAINTFTLWMFLYRPFLWPDSSALQRFMW